MEKDMKKLILVAIVAGSLLYLIWGMDPIEMIGNLVRAGIK